MSLQSSSSSPLPPPPPPVFVESAQNQNAGGPGPGSGGAVTHLKAPMAGTRLPFMCLCGEEFMSDSSLSQHIGQKTMEELIGKGTTPVSSSTSRTNRRPYSPRKSLRNREHDLINSQNQTSKSTSTNMTSTEHGKDPTKQARCHCGRQLASTASLFYHIRRFTKVKEYACRSCDKEFMYPSVLKAHLKSTHRINVSSHDEILKDYWKGPTTSPTSTVSSESGAPTSAPATATRPRKPMQVKKRHPVKGKDGATVSGSNGTELDIGNGNGSTSKSSLDGKRHGKDTRKRLHCLCGNKFKNNVTLYDHLRYFTGEKLLNCKYCNKQFVYASLLKNHLLQVHKQAYRLSSVYFQNCASAGAGMKLKMRRGGKGSRNWKVNHLLGIKMEQEDQDNTPEDQEDGFTGRTGKRYCLCNQVSYGEMVACDSTECPIEWYHYECVGITAAPQGKWYCGLCEARMAKGGKSDE